MRQPDGLRFLVDRDRRRLVAMLALVMVGDAAAFMRPARAEDVAPPVEVRLDASASHTSRGFRMFVTSFPVQPNSVLDKVVGRISITSNGQGFAEALVTVLDFPPESCPVSGDFRDHREMSRSFPNGRALGRYIIKAPKGLTTSTLAVSSTFSAPIALRGCLAVGLDGAVLWQGGPFTMRSELTATTSKNGPQTAGSTVDVDDEFCFDRVDGCQRATVHAGPDNAFQKVAYIGRDGVLVNFHGNVSDSSFGLAAVPDSVAWQAENSYVLVRKCTVVAGIHGPMPAPASFPAGSTTLLSFRMEGLGHASLERAFDLVVDKVPVRKGDCIIHTVYTEIPIGIGGIDAESQFVAVIR